MQPSNFYINYSSIKNLPEKKKTGRSKQTQDMQGPAKCLFNQLTFSIVEGNSEQNSWKASSREGCDCTLPSANKSQPLGDGDLASEAKLQLKEQGRPTHCEGFQLLPFLETTFLRYRIIHQKF